MDVAGEGVDGGASVGSLWRGTVEGLVGGLQWRIQWKVAVEGPVEDSNGGVNKGFHWRDL